MNHRHHRRERQNTDRSHKRIRLRNYAPWLRAAGGRPIFRIILAQQTQSRLGLKLLQAARPTCGLLRFHFDLCHFSVSECPDALPSVRSPRMMVSTALGTFFGQVAKMLLPNKIVTFFCWPARSHFATAHRIIGRSEFVMTISGFKEDNGADRVTIRDTTYIMCVLDAVGWAFASIAYFASGSDPSTKGFDHAAGVIVTTLFVITAIPACVLTLMNRAPKTALTFALAFPSAFAVLFLTAMIAFS